MLSKSKREEIENFILRNVQRHPQDITALTAGNFSVSRQAIHRYLRNMVDAGVLAASGTTRSKRYELALIGAAQSELLITPTLEEHKVWQEHAKPALKGIPKHLEDICVYGFTEMFNNVIDHSEGTLAEVQVTRNASEISMRIADNGIGIFNKIASSLQLTDARESLLELSKGKFTTDPQRHSGEGIFFTSRAFDSFHILSGTFAFMHWDAREDWLFEDMRDEQEGTMIVMEISMFSDRILKDVFDKYASGDDYGFTRTHVPVALAKYGDANLVSRSQAKRVLARFDRFTEVLLDFTNIQSIGQGFADEIFRVFASQHPEIRILEIGASDQVTRMIKRVRSQA